MESIRIPGAEANDAKRVIAAELESVRKTESSLPKIAQKLQQNRESNFAKMAAMSVQEHQHAGVGTNKVSQDFLNRFAAARRGAMLGGSNQAAQIKIKKGSSPPKAPRREGGSVELERAQSEEDKAAVPPGEGHPGATDSGASQARRSMPELKTRPSVPELHHSPGASTQLPHIAPRKAPSPPNQRKMSVAATGRVGVRYRGRRHARALQRRRGGGVRPESRVGKLLSEFKVQDDWVAQTILKHQLASILQATVKGWLVRKKWATNCHALVDSLHERIRAEEATAARRAELRRMLEERKSKGHEAEHIVQSLFAKPAKRMPPPKAKGGLGLGGKWTQLKAFIHAEAEQSRHPQPDTAKLRGKDVPEPEPSGSESEFSDLEMDDIATVKLRAATPPWQRMEQSLWLGQYNKLGKKNTRAAIEGSWDLDQSGNRLEGARQRRMARNPDGEDCQKGGLNGEFDPSTQKLSHQRVNELLYPAYMRRFARMGLLDYNPLEIPPSLATQGQEDGLSEEDDELADSKLLYTVEGAHRPESEDPRKVPFAQLKPNQDKTPELLAAELDFPVPANRRKNPTSTNAAKANQTKQDLSGKPAGGEGGKQGGRKSSNASGGPSEQ